MSLLDPAVSQKLADAASLLQGIDYVELYVGNARQSAHYYKTAFGFTPIAYAGLETGVRDRASYVLRQGESFLIVTEPLIPECPIAEYISMHGDGVKDIALRVQDVERMFEHMVRQGAQPLQPPTTLTGRTGRIIKATVAAYGDVVHSLVQRDEDCPSFFPTFDSLDFLP